MLNYQALQVLGTLAIESVGQFQFIFALGYWLKSKRCEATGQALQDIAYTQWAIAVAGHGYPVTVSVLSRVARFGMLRNPQAIAFVDWLNETSDREGVPATAKALSNIFLADDDYGQDDHQFLADIVGQLITVSTPSTIEPAGNKMKIRA